MEIVHEGWLTKSPPEKRIWKAKWRERWFVLKQSGDIPGQFVLEYYADQTKRKFKGSIDLDQCEQVDAGLQLESRKANYKHMFDVRTSKRTFYLVAKSEADMNKWVDCICQVCGLKIHVDEGSDYRYSPQPSQEFAFSQNNSNGTSMTLANNNQSQNVGLMSSNMTSNRISVEGPSGPYIPISECRTGKPINGPIIENNNIHGIVSNAKVNRLSDQSYDVPRNANEIGENNLDLLYQVPSVSAISPDKTNHSLITNPPKVNWSTYPRESPVSFNSNDVTRTSIRSCDAVIDGTSKLTNVNDSGTQDMQRSNSPMCTDFNRDSIMSNDTSQNQPPPRPPKPPSLRRSKTKSESCASLPSASTTSLYDIPAPPTKQDESSPTSKISSSSIDMSPKSPDDSYDFPRLQAEFKPNNQENKGFDLLNERVPINDKSAFAESKKHSYSNAPSGYFVNKENVFNYDYKPTLPTSSIDDTQATFTFKQVSDQESSNSERSPVTPTSASYNNLTMSSSLPNSSALNITPPAINRDLKPRRKGSDSDTTNALLSSPAALQLAPPPALTRIHSAPTKKSFRKPRNSLGQSQGINGTPPRIPTRIKHKDHSASEDDLSLGGSRRNSANDDRTYGNGPIASMKPRRFDGCEIQYLDLDLDSDSNSQSPRTPNEHIHQRSNSTPSNREPLNMNGLTPQNSVIMAGASTVYMPVDFVKTEALNKIIRQKAETYRNSQ